MIKKIILLQLISLLILCTENDLDKFNATHPLDMGGENWNPPTVIAPNDTIVAINDSIILKALGDDQNGEVVSYCWIFGKNADTLYSDVSGYKTLFLNADTLRCYVYSMDNDSLLSINADSFTIEIREYKPVIDTQLDLHLSAYDTICFSVSAYDSNGTLDYLWAFNSDSNYVSTGNDSILDTLFTTGSSFYIKTKVIDDDSLESEIDSFHVFVHLHRPTIKTSFSEVNAGTGQLVNMSVSAYDTNGVIKGYKWAKDGINFITSSDSVFDTSYSTTGMKTILVKSFDDDSLESLTDTIRILVKGSEPLLHSPINNSILDENSIQLNWRPGFYNSTYTVLFGLDSANMKIQVAGIKDSGYIINDLLFDSCYYWAIIGFDSLSNVDTSEIWSFNIGSMPLINLLSPKNNSIYEMGNFNLAWVPGFYDNTFSIYFDTINPPIKKIATTVDSFFNVINRLDYGKTYYWKIIANDGVGNKDSSDIYSFSIVENASPKFLWDSLSLSGNALIDNMYKVKLDVFDKENDSLSISLIIKPENAYVYKDSVKWEPSISDSGINLFSAVVEDSFGGKDTIKWTVNVDKASYKGIPLLLKNLPLEYTVDVGDSVKFNVEAVGGNLRFDWMLNNVVTWPNVGSEITFNAVNKFPGNRTYRCIISNEFGSCSSNTILLTVQDTGKCISLFSFNASNNSEINDDIFGSINNSEITLTVPLGTSLKNLIPTISISPNSNLVQDIALGVDFSAPVYFDIVAENGETKKYTIIVTHRPIYVNCKALGNNNGDSWDNAYVDLQDAIDVSVEGSEIWVAKGTYTPTSNNDTSISFSPKAHTKLYGGFSGIENNLSERDISKNNTRLSGKLSDGYTKRLISVDSLNTNVLIDGFNIIDANEYSFYVMFTKLTIMNCNLSDSSRIIFNESEIKIDSSVFFFPNYPDYGIVDFVKSDLQISNTIFRGSGIDIVNGTADINNCEFYDMNKTGIICPNADVRVNKCMFNNISGTAIVSVGVAQNGSKFFMDSSSIYHSTNNMKYYEGGAGLFLASDSVTIKNSYFYNNHVNDSATGQNGGGAIYLYRGGMSVNIENCSFRDNFAQFHGGAIALAAKEEKQSFIELKLENCTFTNNFNLNDSSNAIIIGFENEELNVNLDIINCTFGKGGGIINSGFGTKNILIVNSLFYDVNSLDIDSMTQGNLKISYSLLNNLKKLSSNWILNDTVSGNPLLGSSVSNGGPVPTMAISTNSPAKDAGTSIGAPSYDARGVSRPQGKAIDIGAYELVE